MAPSGKFWMAMPRERAKAPVRVISSSPWSIPANTTPTAIPSGILWSVTARTSMVVFFQLLFKPSGSSQSMCRWGTRWSMASRKAIPSRNPTAAGTKANFPISAAISMDGISSDQTEAATITPEAKPRSIF